MNPKTPPSPGRVLLAALLGAAGHAALPARAEPGQLPEFQLIRAAENPTPAGPPAPASSFRSWTVSHGDAGSRRYSSLDQINRSNVRELAVAWTYHSNDGHGPIQCNPIVVDGVMYGPTPGHALVALDATTGRERWRFQLEKAGEVGLQNAPARRGLVYWPGNERERPRIVFACDYWIYALDPASGQLIATFGHDGRTPLPTGQAAVGVVWNGTYIVPGVFGDIYGFDLGSGAQLWRFHTIPRPGEFGGESWQGGGHEGANCWGGLALDEARGIVYAGIGNPWPSFVGTARLGDNLYSDCLLALDARTGRRLWHFQNVRHDLWDLDCPAAPNLLTITRNGRRIDAVACVNKPGDTLLFDRVSGQPIFPLRLRRAPESRLPGEFSAPYQPDPELPEPISSPEFKADDITNRSPAAHDFIERIVKRAAIGWFQPPTEGGSMLFHSSRGGAEWTGACIDVPTGRLYVNSNHIANLVTVERMDEAEFDSEAPPSPGRRLYLQACAGCHKPTRQGGGLVPPLIGLRMRMADKDVVRLLRTGRGGMPAALPMTDRQRQDLLDFLMRRNQPAAPPASASRPPEYIGSSTFLNDQDGYPGCRPPWGLLNCLDMNTGRILWRVPLGEYAELTRQGMPVTGTENFGGPTVTAGGLVFCAGTRDRKIRAFDKDSGAELWSATLPWGGFAPPAVYEVNGREFVVIAAAGGGVPGLKAGSLPTGDAYVAFSLPALK